MTERDGDPLAMAYVLAAIAAGDRTASRGAIGGRLLARVAQVREENALQPDRAAGVAQLTQALVVTLREDAPLSDRARGIAAILMRKEVGAEWMRRAPAPRSGFRTSAALRRTIAALAEPKWRG